MRWQLLVLCMTAYVLLFFYYLVDELICFWGKRKTSDPWNPKKVRNFLWKEISIWKWLPMKKFYHMVVLHTCVHIRYLPFWTPWVKVTRLEYPNRLRLGTNQWPTSQTQISEPSIDISRTCGHSIKEWSHKRSCYSECEGCYIDEMIAWWNNLMAMPSRDDPTRIYKNHFSLPRPEPSWTWESKARNSITNWL